jgi:3-methyladenine DNA glycosylase AlkC
MAVALKRFFSPSLVRRMAADLVRAHPAFPAERFVKRATRGLRALELLDRGRHIALALAECLPNAYPDAVAVLLRSLGPEHASDELVGAGMEPFFYLPHTLYVAKHGLEHFDLSIRAQYELTKRFSAEGSIRPYIAKFPDRTLAVLHQWTGDPDPHVRRLVSEGTRLRLPWAQRVDWLDAHPERVLELLELLKDDPSTMVRRSVANNLNDLGKIRPDLLIRTCAAWLRDAPPERGDLVEHALRSAVKRGEPDALRLLGYGREAAVLLKRVRFVPARVPIGGRVTMSLTLCSTIRAPQHLLIDVVVHFVKTSGNVSRKVFKLRRITLPPRGAIDLKTSFSLAVHTTRVPRPGRHVVDVLLNGRPLQAGAFHVLAGNSARRP